MMAAAGLCCGTRSITSHRWGGPGRFLDGGFHDAKLRKMFDYRHETTRGRSNRAPSRVACWPSGVRPPPVASSAPSTALEPCGSWRIPENFANEIPRATLR
jgi:hypothetical protein